MRDFNLLDICWKYNTAERKQSRRFLGGSYGRQLPDAADK